jgi:ABC-type phosphate transport system substrate-binding protein
VVAVSLAGSPDVLVVVVSSRAGSAGLSREEIRNIYTGKTTFWPNNTPVRAYNRPAGSPAGRKFFRSLLGMSSSSFREHWNELQLSGGGIAPATVTSAESILARVAGASGAIGYVLESELPADVPGVRLIRFK